MSDAVKQPLDTRLEAEARAAVAKAFASAIAALGNDLTAILKANGTSKPETDKLVKELTEKMIGLLADRIKGILPPSASKPD